MQLRTARLCLDCEELHDAQQCPVCASESFAYLTRWVPFDERRATRRDPPPLVAEAPPQKAVMRWAKRGAAGLAFVAIGRWAWNLIQPRDAEFERR
jgi:hypothetical protein